MRWTTPRARFPRLDYAPEAEKAGEQADVVLHLTECQQHRDLDPAALAGVVRVPRLVDARNALPVERWQAAGWSVRALGRSL